MKTILYISSFLFCYVTAFEQDVNYLVQEGNALEKSMKDDEALLKYTEALKLAPSDFSALVNTSRLYSITGARIKDKKKQVEYLQAARTYAASGLLVGQDSAQSHYVMALAMDKLALTAGGKEKATYLREVKKHADSTLLINPKHIGALHLLGKWNMEIATSSVTEKAALKVLYGGLPSASLQVSIINFEKAKQGDPWFVANYLELAKAYIANGQTDKAIEALNRMIKLPPRTADDAGLKTEGKKLLESLL